MARRRRRKGALRQSEYRLAVFAFAILLLIVFVASYPLIALVLVLILLAAGYWRWWARPRRRAEEQRAAIRDAEQADRDREELAQRYLRERSQSLGGLLALTAREFEIRVGEILCDYGYDDIEHVGRAGDLGIDLFATDPSGERVGIQCKRYAPDKLVRAPEVRLLYGDMTHANVRGVFVTTSGYTADAASYAESHGINLIDGARLAQLLVATSPAAPLRSPPS